MKERKLKKVELKKVKTKNVSKFSMPTHTTTHQSIISEIKAGRKWDGGVKND